MPGKRPIKRATTSLFGRAAFEAFILGLPATTLVRQWGDASVGKVGGKIFAIYALGEAAAVSFKCSDMAFDMLPELTGITPAPYLARAKWVQVAPTAPLTEAELAAYVAEAHRLVAAKLTRQQRADLGLAVTAAPRRF